MIATEEFIALLEEKDLVAPKVVEYLRRQAAQDPRISAALLAKWLVDRGHLSRILAQRLLTRAEESARPSSPPAHEEQFSWEKQAEAEEEELGLAPLDDEIPSLSTARKKRPSARPPKRPATTKSRPTPQPPGKQPEPPAKAADDLILLGDDDVAPAGPAAPTPLGGLMDDPSLSASATTQSTPLGPMAPRKRGLAGLFRRSRRVGRRENVWDSPLLLIGGGALLLLLILGAVLLWRLRRMGAEDLIKLADEDYRAGSYTQAIAKYDDYLERFPGHSDASRARVRRGLARLRQATDRATDWPAALQIATEVLPEIATEEDFRKEGEGELVAMLPKIAEGLARQAAADLDPAFVEKSEEALRLVNKHILPSRRPVTKLEEIQQLLGSAKWNIARSGELEKTVAAMKASVEQGDPAGAYEERTTLLKKYPDLIDNAQLREAVLAASEAELSRVTFVDERRPAVAAEPPGGTPAAVVLARRSTKEAPAGAEGHVIYVLAGPSSYGLDAASGRILWRRPTGFAANGRNVSFPPTPVSKQAASDAILVDSGRDEVVRIEAATGRPCWRHALRERFDAHPVVAGERLLVATRSGRLVFIDLETGESSGYFQFQQELRTGPAVDLDRMRIYQVAEHSNLFVLSLADRKPEQVVYLGHEPGSIDVPPVRINRYLVVAENDGVNYATLHVLSLEAETEDEPPVRVLQDIQFVGHVDTPPQVYGDRMLVATDRGALYVLEVKGADPNSPLSLIAQSTAAGQERGPGERSSPARVSFPLLRGSQVWVADSQLTQYDLNPVKGRLSPRTIHNERSATMEPPVAIGQTVFHVRRKLGIPGVLVSAVDPERAEPLWETHLAVPLAAEPMIDAATGEMTAVTTTGALYQMQSASIDGRFESMSKAPAATDSLLKSNSKAPATQDAPTPESPEPGTDQAPTFVDEPTVALKLAEIHAPVADLVPLEDGLLALTFSGTPFESMVEGHRAAQTGSAALGARSGDLRTASAMGQKELPVFDPEHPTQFRRLFLPDWLSGPPIAFAGGLLAPCRIGQVFLLDPRSGDWRTEPFQPTLEGGVQVRWSRGARYRDDQILLAARSFESTPRLAALYRIGIQAQPKPHLAMLAKVDLAEPLISPIAVVGDVAYAVDAARALLTFELPDLTKGRPRSLGARSVWGPGRVGDHVLLATDDEQLYCLDAEGEIAWQIGLPYGPLAGAPLAIDAPFESTSEPPEATQSGSAPKPGETPRRRYVLAAASGVIWCVDPQTGKELARVDVGYPLGTGPVAFSHGLLVGGYDGSLFRTRIPTPSLKDE